MILLHTVVSLHRQNINQTLGSQKHPYLALRGKLWGVYCEDIGGNTLCYNGILL